ncbi:uncharacterized protein LOC144663335 isoform X2 [Oculina patagonica]
MSTQEKMGWLEKLFTYLQQYHVSMNEQQLRSNYMHPAKVLNIPASSQFVFQISINQGTTQRSPDFCKVTERHYTMEYQEQDFSPCKLKFILMYLALVSLFTGQIRN